MSDNAPTPSLASETLPDGPVIDEMIAQWVAEAELDRDVRKLRSGAGRPPIGTAAATPVTIRLDPELEAALDERVAREGSTRSQVVRDALHAWL